MKRAPWGHVSRRCIYCGKVGPRTIVAGGWAHKRCLPSAKRPKNYEQRAAEEKKNG